MNSFLVGIGLSAACGLRIFLPLLGLSLFAVTGRLTFPPEFAWLTSQITIIIFTVASVLEVMSFYRPRLDNIIDALAVPIVVIAGTICFASTMEGISPFWRWTAALVLGGGIALTIEGATIFLRASVTANTGGIGNNIVATGELGGVLFTTFLAFAAPLWSGVWVLVLLTGAIYYLYQRFLANRKRSVKN